VTALLAETRITEFPEGTQTYSAVAEVCCAAPKSPVVHVLVQLFDFSCRVLYLLRGS
jgi:hypothetical protein